MSQSPTNRNKHINKKNGKIDKVVKLERKNTQNNHRKVISALIDHVMLAH